MSESYAREILRRNVAQICQTIGWNGINSTPVDILVHVLEKYIRTVGTQAIRYAEQFNRTEPNLNDLGLVFQDLHVQIPELADYTRCVSSVPLPFPVVDKFPKAKESNLNFLKPGSHEVVTRPMHVHEHLPPMYPEKERDTPAVADTVEIQQNGIENIETSTTVACASPEISVTDSPEKPKDIFKRPTDPVSLPNSKKPRLRLDEEERTREIRSVMMTMSGFLSPAREGKLPEARPPTLMSEKHNDKHKTNSHHANPAKVPTLEKSDKKSKKNKLINGKIMKSKRKDKSHKGESSKSKDSSKANKHSPGHAKASKDGQQAHNHVPKQVSKSASTGPKSVIPPVPLVPEQIRPVIKQEPVDLQASKSVATGEAAIPVPKKIPISKSPLVSNAVPVNKQSSTNTLISETDMKKELIDDEEKLASQPDRSKINIFKRISNKSKEDKTALEVVPEKAQSDSMISKVQNSAQENPSENKKNENIKVKSDETLLNNNDKSTLNLLDTVQRFDLTAHEVVNIADDDSMETFPAPLSKSVVPDPLPNISLDKTLHVPYSKDIASVSPKTKKEKKHKDKKDKANKLLKKQQQQLAFEMAQADKQTVKMGNTKSSKSSRPKNESNLIPPIGSPHPFIPYLPVRRNLMPGPGLIPNPIEGLIPGSVLAGLANNPALRGLPTTNLLTNPFALGASGPGLIPGAGFLQTGIPTSLMHMGSGFPHSSRSSSVKIPPMLRRPSLEVIPVDNDDDRDMHKSPMMGRDKDRHDKHKSPTIPNILQKHKSKSHKDKSSIYKMPPVQPDITIELNPPKVEAVRQEPLKEPTIYVQSPNPEPIPLQLDPHFQPPEIPKLPPPSVIPPVVAHIEKKKDKSHKKEKRDKDGIKIKKKKDKKNKNKNKSERKKEKIEMKEKLKKEKKEKKREKEKEKEKEKEMEKEKEKEKSADGLVPKLTLKLGSSNSNSPMPPSSPDVFKLNIKPVVKKDEEETSPPKEEPVSREHSRSPELAQISALVTRPPKQKHSKHNHSSEAEPQSTSPPTATSPSSKHRPPSSHSKYKRILFKPLSKKGHLEDDMTSMSEEPIAAPAPSPAPAVPASEEPLPTPFYNDEHGNKIWVCPACCRPDNGSPMIGCDGCDGWYHWVCVGITEEPGASEDWFCRGCVSNAGTRLSSVSSGKKRGRKPKGEKLRDCH